MVDEYTIAHGASYVDSFTINARWEVYSLAPDSAKSILRHSWKFVWVNKPYIISGPMHDMGVAKVEKSLDYYLKITESEEFLNFL